MPPYIRKCVICGYGIQNDETISGKWLKEFRAVYSTPDDGYYISGVGSFDDHLNRRGMEAPVDPVRRYDDEDYDSQVKYTHYATAISNWVHSFVLHSICWDLLGEASKPNDVPIRRFIEICSSLPESCDLAMDWGHSYGNILGGCCISGAPWVYRKIRKRSSDAVLLQYATANPYDVPEVFDLLTATSNIPKHAEASQIELLSHDVFGTLPWELLEMIAEYLPTRDALALRLSSRSFVPLFHSQLFWARRFKRGTERGFLFEIRNTSQARDWLHLYCLTSHSQSPPGLKNRRRIWSLIEYLVQLLNLRHCEESTHIAPPSVSKWHETTTIVATADIQGPFTDYSESGNGLYSRETVRPVGFLLDGCLAFRHQHISIPQDLTAIDVSFAGISSFGYISGLTFKSMTLGPTQLGFFSPNSRVLVQVQELRGFVLAISPLGIRAIRIIQGDVTRSAWIGFPKDTPVTECLSEFDTTAPLKASVDGYKIVALTVNKSKERRKMEALSQFSIPLRTTALWYPSVPPRELCLNEINFKTTPSSRNRYFPLCWTTFGGPKGIDLQYLTSVSFTHKPSDILFGYTQDGSVDLVQFGSHIIPHGVLAESEKKIETDSEVEIIELSNYNLAPVDYHEFEVVQKCIDGPGGEYIQEVQIIMSNAGVFDLELITNKGTRIGTPDPMLNKVTYISKLRPDWFGLRRTKSLVYYPGTTITGFYGAIDSRNDNLKSFGVISEYVGLPKPQGQRDIHTQVAEQEDRDGKYFLVRLGKD